MRHLHSLDTSRPLHSDLASARTADVAEACRQVRYTRLAPSRLRKFTYPWDRCLGLELLVGGTSLFIEPSCKEHQAALLVFFVLCAVQDGWRRRGLVGWLRAFTGVSSSASRRTLEVTDSVRQNVRFRGESWASDVRRQDTGR